MKKILIVHPALVLGGAETTLLNYLKILASKPNYQVDILFIENRENHNLHKIPFNVKIHYLLSGIESEFFIYSSITLGKNNFSNASSDYYRSWVNGINKTIEQRFLAFINSYNPDVLIDFHRNYSGITNFLYNYNIHKRIKLIYWIHSSWLLERFKENKDYFTVILSKCDYIIPICDDMRNLAVSILDSLNISSTKLNRIYNPIDIKDIHSKMFCYNNSDLELLNDNYILQVSRLEDKEKNISEMIDIFYKLKQKGVKEKLYLIGEGTDRQLIQDKINYLGLEKECLLLGKRDNPFPFMKNAKLFIHTANYEGFGLVLAESMICGTPVVSFDCPTGPKEILDYGKYGALIPLGHQEMFIDNVYTLLIHEEKRQHYISLLPEAIERFSFETVGKQLFDLLDS